MAAADWYALLSEAQFYYYTQMAIHCPWALMTSAVLTTANSGATYTFASSVVPLWKMLYASATGDFLRPGSYDDPNADYVDEGGTIRIPRGGTRTWAGGPFARYIITPVALDGSVAPTLTPDHARILMVYHAVAEWARQGGMRDPAVYETKELHLAWGVPGTGDVGILGALKLRNPFSGMEAYAQPGRTMLSYLATRDGYAML